MRNLVADLLAIAVEIQHFRSRPVAARYDDLALDEEEEVAKVSTAKVSTAAPSAAPAPPKEDPAVRQAINDCVARSAE